MKRYYLYLFICILVLFIALAACGSSADDPDRPIGTYDFDTVCKGEGLAKAPAYDPSQSGIHRISLMKDSTIGAQYDDYSPYYSSNLPEEWFPQVVDGKFSYDDIELTGCIHFVEAELAEACEFEDEYTLNVHNATYELTVYATQTAEVLAQKTVTVPGECPSMHMFTEGEFEEDYFPLVDEGDIQKFISPFVES